MTLQWADADLGRALREVMRAMPPRTAGPVLTHTIEGWEASATRIDGRRFRETVRASAGNPVEALERLAGRLYEEEER